MSTPHPTLGFIGAGNMAEAIARGLLASHLFSPQDLRASDLSEARRTLFATQLQIPTTDNSSQVAAQSDILLLAVKPQAIAAALAQIAPSLRPQTLVLSIVAAITTRYLESALATPQNPAPRLIRIMPNTPMLVGAGMSALAKGKHATDADLALAESLFQSGGKTVRTSETHMDAITALSGSGPAYVFYLVEALTAGGAALGLPESDAALLARQTIIGAAALLDKSPEAPAELRRKVTSPGGTTQAGVAVLESGRFFDLIAQTLAAAEKRGHELSK